MTNWLLGGAAVAGLVLAGCSSGPPIHTTVGRPTAFCNDLANFANQVAALNNAANEPASTLAGQVQAGQQSLVKLEGEAPAGDTVGGHSVKADLGTEASAFAQLAARLSAASSTDPAAVKNALDNVNAQTGGSVTDATNRLDAYAKTVCGVTVGSPNPTTTTTAAPAGPTGPSTTAGPSSTIAPSSTTAPSSSGGPSSTTAP